MQKEIQRFEKAMQIFSLKCSRVTKLQNRQFQKKLDAYLHDENHEQISGDDEILFDDEYVEHAFNPNNSQKRSLLLSESKSKRYRKYASAKKTNLCKSKCITLHKKQSEKKLQFRINSN